MDGGRSMVGGAGVDVERDRELRCDSLLSGIGGAASCLGHLYTVSLLSSSSGTLAQLTVESGDLLPASHECVVSVLSHLCHML
jgi:hypothetical protein